MALDLSKFKKVQSTDSQYNIPTSGQSSIKAINTPQVTSLSPSQTDSQSTQDSNPQWMTGIAEALPTVGGVLGSIGGGLAAGIAATPETLGTATVPAALLGSSAGSASGQAIGEWFKELIEKKPVSSSEISKQAGIGGIYGLIPGGEELNLAAKIGTRVASGAVASGASQAISDIGTNKSSQEKISDVKRASEIGAVSFPVLGGLGDAGISAIKYLGEKIPGDLIQSAIEKPQQTAEAIFKSVQGMLVGHNNIDYAIEKGIIQKGTIQKTDSGIMAEGVGLTTDAINNAMDKSRELSNNVEKQLQEKLATVKTTFGLNDKSFLDGQSLFDFIQRAGTQVQSAIRGRALSQELYSVIPKEESASGKISATTINEMKRVLGDSYHIPGIPEVYNKLQTLVEKLSPESHDLNQEASRLIGIKSRLKDWLDPTKSKGGALPSELSPQGISDAVNKAGKGTPKSLQSLFSVMALAGMGVSTAIGGITKGITGATAAGVSSFALRKTIIDMLNAAYESPESKIALSHALIGLFDSGSDATRKTIAETLQKLSQRAPQAISNNIGNNQKVSGPVISNYSNSAVTPGKTK